MHGVMDLGLSMNTARTVTEPRTETAKKSVRDKNTTAAMSLVCGEKYLTMNNKRHYKRVGHDARWIKMELMGC